MYIFKYIKIKIIVDVSIFDIYRFFMFLFIINFYANTIYLATVLLNSKQKNLYINYYAKYILLFREICGIWTYPVISVEQ